MEGTHRVLLNASRSEAEELLCQEPPPRPGSLQDSAKFHADDLYSHLDDALSPKSFQGSEAEPPGRKPEGRLWAPPSRSSGGGSRLGQPPMGDGGAAG